MDPCETPPADSDSLQQALRALAHAPPVEPGDGPLLPGTIVGEAFRIDAPIGAGGMGVVYRAWDIVLQRTVAIKVHGAGSETGLHRLMREARALARLSHPNVITVHEVGTVGQRVFIAMEYVDGVDARRWLEEPRRSVREILDLFIAAGKGLIAAHEAGLIHRDFKPSNVLVGRDGRVLVADFGLVRQADETDAARAPAAEMVIATSRQTDPDSVTRTGALLGTPAYMAPEQWAGAAVDARADQYAFCVALQEALVGMRADLEGATDRDDADPTARERGAERVPKWVRAILRRGLMLDPNDRFASMQELLDRLRGDPTRGRRWAVLGVGVLLALGGTAVATRAATSHTPCRDVGRSVERVWNEDIATEVDTALRATGSPLADAASTQLRPIFDRYAARWSEQRREVCEATRLHGDQSEAMLELRMACLDRRRGELGAVIDVLHSADVALVEHAVDTLGALGSLDACADVAALRAELAPPDDPATRAAVEEIRDRIASVDANNRAGRALQARAVAEAAVTRAQELAHGPTVAHASLAMADVLYHLAEHDAAIRTYLAAHTEAMAAGSVDIARAAAIGIARGVGRTSAGTDEALRWFEVMDGWTRRMTTTRAQRGAARRARADVLLQAGRFEEAAAQLEQTLAEIGDEPELELARAASLVGLGLMWHRARRDDDALLVTVAGLELTRTVLGDAHPEVARALKSLAAIERGRGRGEAALEVIERALAIEREHRGADSPATAAAMRERADTLRVIGRHGEAIAEYEAALRILEGTATPDAQELVLTHGNLAAVLGATGAYDRSIAHMRGALELALPTFGADSLRVGEIQLNFGAILSTAGRVEESIEHTLTAIAILEPHLGPEHPGVVAARGNLASNLATQGRFAEAHAQMDVVEKATLARFGRESVAWDQANLARGSLFEHELRIPEARERFHDAVEIFARVLDPDALDLCRARLRYGELLEAAGERAAAVEPLRRAVETAERTDLSPRLLGRARFALARALWADRARRDEARSIAAAAIPLLEATVPEEAENAERWLRSRPR